MDQGERSPWDWSKLTVRTWTTSSSGTSRTDDERVADYTSPNEGWDQSREDHSDVGCETEHCAAQGRKQIDHIKCLGLLIKILVRDQEEVEGVAGEGNSAAILHELGEIDGSRGDVRHTRY